MKYRSIIFIALLLAAIVLVPGVSAENQTRDTIYLLTHAETLAGQKDMSRYSNMPKPQPIETMNESTARLYPNVTWCRNDCMVSRPCSFPFTRCESPLTAMIVYNVNATDPGQPGPVVGYGLTGWPLQNPVFVGSGNSNLNLASATVAGMFHPTGIVSVRSTPSASIPQTLEFLDYQNAPPTTREQKETVRLYGAHRFVPVAGYGMTGWPLQNPVFVSRSGVPAINLPFETLDGLFYPTEIVSVPMIPPATYLPSREYLDYTNAPVLTMDQKATVLQIARNSGEFEGYLNEPHGPIAYVWTYRIPDQSICR
jgi:hypothetical protein